MIGLKKKNFSTKKEFRSELLVKYDNICGHNTMGVLLSYSPI